MIILITNIKKENKKKKKLEYVMRSHDKIINLRN